jgi:twitching motility protein PilT
VPKIDRFFDQLLELKGSDLHVAVGAPPMARARGELVKLREEEMSKQELEGLLF